MINFDLKQDLSREPHVSIYLESLLWCGNDLLTESRPGVSELPDHYLLVEV